MKTEEIKITLPTLPGCTFFSHAALAACVEHCLVVQERIDELKRTGNVVAFTVAMLADGEFEQEEVAEMIRTGKRWPMEFGFPEGFE
jgi:hypothetical protein